MRSSPAPCVSASAGTLVATLSLAACATTGAPAAPSDVCAVVGAALGDVISTENTVGVGNPPPGEISDVTLPSYRLAVPAFMSPQGAWGRADLGSCPEVVSRVAASRFRLVHGRRIRPDREPPLYWFSTPRFSADGSRATLAFTQGSRFSGWVYEAVRSPSGAWVLDPASSDMWMVTS